MKISAAIEWFIATYYLSIKFYSYINEIWWRESHEYESEVKRFEESTPKKKMKFWKEEILEVDVFIACIE